METSCTVVVNSFARPRGIVSRLKLPSKEIIVSLFLLPMSAAVGNYNHLFPSRWIIAFRRLFLLKALDLGGGKEMFRNSILIYTAIVHLVGVASPLHPSYTFPTTIAICLMAYNAPLKCP